VAYTTRQSGRTGVGSSDRLLPAAKEASRALKFGRDATASGDVPTRNAALVYGVVSTYGNSPESTSELRPGERPHARWSHRP
jgi:hypothetical protein